MRSAGRVTWVSRALVVLGFLSLLVPAVASASGKGGGGRQVKTRTTTRAKDSKKKMAVQRATQGKERRGKDSKKAAGFLPRPAEGKSTTSKATEGNQRGMLASALTGGSTARPATKASARRTAKTRRPVRKTRVTRKTRRPNAKKRRAARTQRNRPRRSSQGLEESAAAAEAPDPNAPVVTPLDVGAEQPVAPQRSRFRRILSRAGRAIRSNAKYLLVVAAPAAVLAAGFTIVGGATVMGIGFAIAAPTVMLGIPLIIGLREQAAKQSMGIDDPQAELLQRYMGRQMLENHDLNGPGPGNNVSGAGGLNSLNNMIDPGGMR